MDVASALAPLRNAFPSWAEFQGESFFKYAVRGGSLLIEIRRSGLFYGLVLVGEKFVVEYKTNQSKLAPMHTIGQSLRLPHAP